MLKDHRRKKTYKQIVMPKKENLPISKATPQKNQINLPTHIRYALKELEENSSFAEPRC